ncbi:MAG: metal ABC transporter permease [Pseudomonadota bacterium]
MSWLLDPLSFEFMRQAFVISCLIGAAAGALSCLLVLKGWSLMGDAISHAVLPGVVLAYIVGAPLILGAFLAGLFCAGATGFLTQNSRIKPDTVMGVVFSGMFALGIVLYTAIETEVHLDHILFGDMLGVTWWDIAETAAISLLVLGLIVAFRRDLLLHAFDPQHARAVGLPVRWLHYGLLAAISLVVVGALKAVGLILAIALLIGPGAIAHLLTDRFDRMMAISVCVALVSTIAGIYLAFHVDAAPAPSIVVVMTGLFMVAFLFAPRHGILRAKPQFREPQPARAPVSAS